MLTTLTLKDGMLHAGEHRYACRIGRAGLTGDKHEGDLKTPLGSFAMRWCYYRPDRVAMPDTALPIIPITPDDGWCDDAGHALYNQPIKLPFDASHEKLWREDAVYDLIVPLGYNDGPIVPGKGSAIFLHIMREDGVGTEGCLALTRADLQALLRQCGTQTHIEITA